MSLIYYDGQLESPQSADIVITVPVATLNTTRFAPVLKSTVIVPVKALTLTTFAPVVKLTVVVPVKALTTTKFAPQLRSTIVVPVRTTTTTKFAPVIKSTIIVPVKALTLTTFAPTVVLTPVGADITIIVPKASLVLTTFAPTVVAPTPAQPGQGGAWNYRWRELLRKALEQKPEEKAKARPRLKRKAALTIDAIGRPATARFRARIETRGHLTSTGGAALVHFAGRTKASRRAIAITRASRIPEAVAEAPLAVERRDRRRDIETRAAVAAADSHDFQDFDEVLLNL